MTTGTTARRAATRRATARRSTGPARTTGALARHTRVLHAPATAVWPWLVQMGNGRAGFYSLDLFDNGNERSAREVHPEWQDVRVGDRLPATPDGTVSFEVLRIEPPALLELGGLWDNATGRQLPFSGPRPDDFFQMTWAFSLTATEGGGTSLDVAVRAAFPRARRRHELWARPVHDVMQRAQLRNLARRVEGRLPRDDWRDVAEGLRGALAMAAALARPDRRAARCRWGVHDDDLLRRAHPGDHHVPRPRWGWTHAVDVDAPAEQVWPWVAQLGADRGGFYSYQWLENLVGCGVRNAETVHPEWEVRDGDSLVLHPTLPLPVTSVDPGRSFVAFKGPDEAELESGRPWLSASWAFEVEPLGRDRSRVVSRYRAEPSGDLAGRLLYGPTVTEPIGSTMDRRMLRGIRLLAERLAHTTPPGPRD